jgi:hypothetical protein
VTQFAVFEFLVGQVVDRRDLGSGMQVLVRETRTCGSAQKRNAICSRLPTTYALRKTARIAVAARLTSGARRLLKT